jgi:hypothetical protein
MTHIELPYNTSLRLDIFWVREGLEVIMMALVCHHCLVIVIWQRHYW